MIAGDSLLETLRGSDTQIGYEGAFTVFVLTYMFWLYDCGRGFESFEPRLGRCMAPPSTLGHQPFSFILEIGESLSVRKGQLG